MANAPATRPTWEELLRTGIDYVKTAQPAWIYIGAIAAIQLVLAVVQNMMFGAVQRGAFGFAALMGMLFSLIVLAITLYLTLWLTRHALTGTWGPRPSDNDAALRLIGVGLAAAIAAMVAFVVLGAILGTVLGRLGIVLCVVAVAGSIVYVAARIGFYLPALAVEHPTSLQQAYAQSEPYWLRLAMVMLFPTLTVLVVVWILGELLPAGGVASVFEAIVVGGLSATAQAITIAAVAALYASAAQAGR
jgi:hypothetical protein